MPVRSTAPTSPATAAVSPWRVLLALLSVLAVVLPLAPASAHEEREVTQPDDGAFPEHRDDGPTVVVCKPDSADRIAALPAPVRERNEALLADCEFEHIQLAVNWIAENGEPGYRILVLPGIYREEPSRDARERLHGAPIGATTTQARQCEEITADAAGSEQGDTPGGEQALTYEEQLACPHFQNLIAVHGDTTPADDQDGCDGNLCDLQIEGTGVRPADVIVDGKFGSGFLNGIKGDRASGLYLKNLQAQHFEFNGVYVLETDGATIDDVVGSFNHEYGFLSFVSYVLYENCRGQANGDSAVYPGASPDVLRDLGLFTEHRDEATFATEVRACRGHHNALGYSGTTGNSAFIHHNEFDHNSTGLSQDSLFPGHPGTPQNHALIEDNLFHENNVNHYARFAQQGGCDGPYAERDYEDGAVCPAVPLPVGTAIITPGGNFNWVHRNRLYDNWRQGALQFWIPAELREEGPDPDAHTASNCGPDGDQPCPPQETSHWNTYSANRLAENPVGTVQPNGADFAWDIEGQGNCWDQTGDDANTTAAGEITYRPFQEDGASAPSFPDCDPDSRQVTYSPATTIFPEAGCIEYDPATNPSPDGCDWFDVPAVPAAREPEAPTLERIGGADRIETAILASREGYPSQAPTVVLARDDAYPDALAGAPLAHARGGPLLLTDGAGLDERVAAEIERLGAVNAILLGGPLALSQQIESDLAALGFGADDIVRVAGEDRFETAVAIADQLPATDGLLAKGVDEAGEGWPDALAASAAAAMLERPILLTTPDQLPSPTASYLEQGDIESIEIVGGDLAVDPEVEATVTALLDDVERLAGADRFETSLAVARFALQAGADPTELWLTTGANWPDGIAAGSAVAVDEGLLLLVEHAIEDTPVQTWLDQVHPYSVDDEDDTSVADVLERVRLLGGTVAMPEMIADELREGYDAQDGDARGDRSHGTRVRVARFAPLTGADAAYADVTGYVVLEERLDGTTRTRVYVSGLPTAVGTAHPVHAHAEPCSSTPVADNPHYAQDPAGAATEPNEIHAGFRTGPGGTGIGDSTVFQHPGQDAASVMIHAPDGAKQLCADLG